MITGYTDNYSVPLSAFDTPTWVDEDHARWRLLDALIAAINDVDVPFAVATGAADAFVVTYSPAITSYSLGLIISFKANNAITGASTVNVNGLGAKAIKANGEDTELGDIPVDAYVRAIYDGTNFSLIDPKKTISGNRNIIVGVSGATANASTDFYVESSGPTYEELLGPNASTQGYMFSRPAMSYAGGIVYDHINELVVIRVGGNDVWTLDAAGEVTASNFVGTFQGNLTGNVTGSADKWTNARTLTLGTDASGNAAFDGSANFALNLTIVNDAITNAKLANMATSTLKGRVTAGTGDPEDLTTAQATTLINPFTTALKGAVPASTSANRTLYGDGTWRDVPRIIASGRFDGTTGAAISATNLSVVRNSAGDYTATLTTPHSDDNYIIIVTASGATTYSASVGNPATITTSSFNVFTLALSSAPSIALDDCDELHITVISV